MNSQDTRHAHIVVAQEKAQFCQSITVLRVQLVCSPNSLVLDMKEKVF